MSLISRICALLLLLTLLSRPVSAQTAAADSVEVFSPGDLLFYLGQYHPVARQAGLLREQARANLRMARGAFDPKLYGEVNQKVFKGSNYYFYQDGGLKGYLWPGVELKAGYEQANGVYIDPEATTPEAGLLYAGVAVPLGQGLLIDSRRAAVKQAQIFRDAAEAERIVLLNDLYFEAIQAYWNWAEAWSRSQVQGEAVAVAQVRLDAVRALWQFGDRPGIDTLEALIVYQSRQMDFQTAQLEYQKASLSLSNFLWAEDGSPLFITPRLRPSDVQQVSAPAPLASDSVQRIVFSLPETHPSLQRIRYDLASLEVERRLKADKLKPKIYVNYNVLNEATVNANNGEGFFYPGVFSNNYKWGLSVGFPLFLREERGNLELTRIKLQQTRYKQELKQLELGNKVQSYQAEVQNVAGQISLFSNALRNYQALLQAEEIKFQAGESSLFLINARESKVIEAQVKLLELRAKYLRALAGIDWAAGRLYAE
ncbi:MAG: TolC family protein [Bacteroidetes bacterium]|nr:MAG: TolC family protein [Bacteroidota bacterium]